MREKWNALKNRFIEGDRPIKERLFIIICCGAGFADIFSELFCVFVIHSTTSLPGSMLGIVILFLVMYLGLRRKKLQLASCLACLFITDISFPIIFLRLGGIRSGMPIWFVLGIAFEFMLLEGAWFYIMLGSTLVIYSAAFEISYRYPEWLADNMTLEMQHLDIFQSLIIVATVIGFLIRMQLRLYQRKCDQLEKAMEELERANQAERNFLASMSHEIRTPITAIIGMNEMIQRESKEEKTQEYALDINSASHILLSTVNDILDFSKIEAGKMMLIPGEYELAKMLEDLVHMIAVKAKEKNLDFTVKVAPELPSVLKGDDVRIRQVITNILINAVKYTAKGSVRLDVDGSCKDGVCRLFVCVTDTGRGIKQEEISKLFVKYARIEERRSGTDGGTGLGLVICQELLNMMGSELKVESEYGKGTRMFFELEQLAMDKTPIGDFEKRLNRRVVAPTYKAMLYAPKAHVLEVDDNETNRRVFTGLLKYTGIQVTAAASGQEALELVQKQHFDLIFMDHMMPEMDGIETLQRMKQLEHNACEGVPVIMVTANAIMGNREMYLEKGFDDYLSKPIISADLERLLVAMLPEELMEECREQKRESDFYGTLPRIEGISWEASRDYLPDKQSLSDAVDTFYHSLDAERAVLEDLSGRFRNKEQLELYRIHVHSLKSTARMIGAVPLSEMARSAEEAAKAGDIENLRVLTPRILENMSKCKQNLSVLFPEHGQTGKREFDGDTLQRLLTGLRASLEDGEVDEADLAIAQIREFLVPLSLQEKVAALSGYVVNLDLDNAFMVIGQLQEQINDESIKVRSSVR